MTKSITITYQEADESLLMGIFKKFKVKTLKTPVTLDDDELGVPLEVALQMVEGLKWIKQVERGEVEAITWEQMTAELEADKLIEKLLAFVQRLKGKNKVQIKDAEQEILEAMHQMDKGIFHEVSREELFNLIHN